ncbi:integrase core domain-containing protein [Desulfosoma caldarium]|uniref:integrase core domain-containing protein n=1 Tax=Desulfosoma caldarium TaxID=610254 RepID=UPI0024825497|nr:integrase core domain-containing protein [Desulfosoma caldarium]
MSGGQRIMTHFFCSDSGWCHVVAVIDCGNREIVGYRISRRQNARVAKRGFGGCGHSPVKLLRAWGLRPEYITPYSPQQNGMIERFMRTLKEECIWLNLFSSFDEAKAIIEGWIREYNTERPHQELGYLSPVEYRHKLAA